MFLTFCLFGIKCVCVHGFAVFCTCAMFYVLSNRVCVVRVRVTIVKMLCIFIIKGPFYQLFAHIRFSFIAQDSPCLFPHPPFCS